MLTRPIGIRSACGSGYRPPRGGRATAVLSADSREKAPADVEQFGWTFPVGYGLTAAQMRELGLYISSPRSTAETDHLFSEPGLFVINPQGKTQIDDISNAPSARPDLKALLASLQFVIANANSIRGAA